MTTRSEVKHRLAEQKAIAMTWIANRLFSFKQTGLDGFLKRQMLQPARKTQQQNSAQETHS